MLKKSNQLLKESNTLNESCTNWYNFLMIIYNENYGKFIERYKSQDLYSDIFNAYKSKVGHPDSGLELSWHNSIHAVVKSIIDNNVKINNGVEVFIEYKIPRDGSQIDLIFAGANDKDEDSVAIIELKQWTKVKKTMTHGRVKTNSGGHEFHFHPSLQVNNYYETLISLNKDIFTGLKVKQAVFMHNYSDLANEVNDVIYKYWTDLAPIFSANEKSEFAHFLESNISRKSTKDYKKIFDNLEFNPSKSLIQNAKIYNNSLESALKTYTLYGAQKSTFDSIVNSVRANKGNKNLFIIKGGAGTGKTIVALMMYLELMYIGSKIPTRLVFPGLDLRATIESVFKIKENSEIFKKISGAPTKSGQYKKGEFDVAIVDEAHRIRVNSQNTGVLQLYVLLNCHDTVIMLMDDDQSISKYSVGSVENTIQLSKEYFPSVNVDIFELEGQFRCNGGFEYINWLDGWLKNKHDHSVIKSKFSDFEISISGDENEFIKKFIADKESNKRLLTTVTFDWTTRFEKGAPVKDIKIGGRLFNWNPYNVQKFENWKTLSEKEKAYYLNNFNSSDVLSNSSVGYQNTVQGSEFNCVYVYLGKDIFLDNENHIDVFEGAWKDNTQLKSLKGAKNELEREEFHSLNTSIIINAYNVLLTRAIKKVVIFAHDKKLNDYLMSLIKI